MALSFGGLAVRWATVGFVPAGTSGRNTLAQRAATLNTTGLYSLVSNPLYLGNPLALLGLVLAVEVWWFVLVVALVCWLHIELVVAAEEVFLAQRFDDAYARWAMQTSALLRALRRWRRPEARFSLRTVLRREYNGVLAVAAAFLTLEVILDLVIEHE